MVERNKRIMVERNKRISIDVDIWIYCSESIR